MAVCSALRRELMWAPLVVLNARRQVKPKDWWKFSKVSTVVIIHRIDNRALTFEIIFSHRSVMARFLKLFQGHIHVCASGLKADGRCVCVCVWVCVDVFIVDLLTYGMVVVSFLRVSFWRLLGDGKDQLF